MAPSKQFTSTNLLKLHPTPKTVQGKAGEQVTAEFMLLNKSEESPRDAPVLQLDALPEGWKQVGRDDFGGAWRQATREWFWWALAPGEKVRPSITVEIPDDAESGDYELSASADDGNGNNDDATLRFRVTPMNDEGNDGDGNGNSGENGDGNNGPGNGNGGGNGRGNGNGGGNGRGNGNGGGNGRGNGNGGSNGNGGDNNGRGNGNGGGNGRGNGNGGGKGRDKGDGGGNGGGDGGNGKGRGNGGGNGKDRGNGGGKKGKGG